MIIINNKYGDYTAIEIYRRPLFETGRDRNGMNYVQFEREFFNSLLRPFIVGVISSSNNYEEKQSGFSAGYDIVNRKVSCLSNILSIN
jgi:hypothetical protein